MKPRTHIMRGYLAIVLVTAIFGMYGVINREIAKDFGVFSQQWVRNLLVLVIIAFLSSFRIVRLRVSDIRFSWWLVIWLGLGGVHTFLLFFSFTKLPLSTAYFLFYSTMIVSGIACSRVLFFESLTAQKWVSLVLSCIGIGVLFQFSLSQQDLLYAPLPLLLGISLGVWNVIPKKFPAQYGEIMLVGYDAVVSCIIAVVGAIVWSEVPPSISFSSSWYWMIGYAIAQIASIGLMIYGFQRVQGQKGSLILPLELVWGTAFSYIFLGESTTLVSIIGGGIIASSAFIQLFSPSE